MQGLFARVSGALVVVAALAMAPPAAAQEDTSPREVVVAWYGLVLELIRHTPTYSPPVASRSLAYLGVTAYEAVASGAEGMETLAGQLNALTPLPGREAGAAYDEAVVVETALSALVEGLFSNTGPTGQRAISRMKARLAAAVAEDLSADVLARSVDFGAALAEHILAWSREDGGAVVENMGFPLTYPLTPGPAHWVPTSLIQQQQTPLLPEWGGNRAFAMPDGAACPLPPPPAYSEHPDSDFYREAREVHAVSQALTAEQIAIARFWSDDPMLSPTPPGHWISIALQVAAEEDLPLDRSVDLLARLGITLADSFIGCWWAKYEFDLVRPLTYIRRWIDPQWEALLITPPFPEYPSGHSTQSGAAAAVLTSVFGEDFSFVDTTREGDGLKPRSFPSFAAAADEAGISRLYGGIHFRAAIERGLEQGRCIGAYAIALKTLR